MKYVCPMHPEIESNNPGKCPKCGMQLVEKGSAASHAPAAVKNSYTFLILIVGLIFFVSLTLAVIQQPFELKRLISNFMIGFFLVFAGFKLANLKGFADAYSTYDLLAREWYGYGYVYPFLELFFGLSMIFLPGDKNILRAEIVLMGFSGIGVLIKLLKHEQFQCACLGTFLKVPLTKVTLIEDFGMAILAILLLVL